MFERFTERAREAISLAQFEARTHRHSYVGTEHLLLGLLREEDGLAARVLASLEISLDDVRAQVARVIGEGEDVTTGQIPFTSQAKKVLELSLRESLGLGHNYIGTEHLLLALAREENGVAARILRDFGADAEAIRARIIEILRLEPPFRPTPMPDPEHRFVTPIETPARASARLVQFDSDGRDAVTFAQEEARTLRHDRIGTEHMLLGLLRLDGGPAVEALDAVGVTLGRARAEVVRVFGPGAGSPGGQLPFSPRAKERLQLAIDEADGLDSEQVRPEHLLLSIAREREGGAAQVLEGLGVDRTALVGETRRRLGRAPESPGPVAADGPQPALLPEAGVAWALPMLVGALLLGAGILIGWAIWH